MNGVQALNATVATLALKHKHLAASTFFTFSSSSQLMRPRSQASASQATSNSNLGPSSSGARLYVALSLFLLQPFKLLPAQPLITAFSVKAASAASGSGTPNAAGHTPTIVGGSTSSATIGNTQPQSAKTSTYGPSNVAAAQNVPYNASAATSNVGVSTTNPASPAVGSVAASKSSFNIADGSSRGSASTSQSAAATVSTGSTPRAAKNNAGAQAVAGLLARLPLIAAHVFVSISMLSCNS
jgi:hypothetical protein